MALAEREEGFVALAMREISFQNALHRSRRILGLHVLVDLAAEPRVWPESAADKDVVAVDGIAILIHWHARRDQPDVANVVLRAGVMAASEMDVHRRVERDARLAPRGDLLSLLLRVRGGEAAAGRTGTGDEAGAHCAGFRGEAERRDGRLRERNLLVRHARDQQILPHRE